jgi:hypothetical protein
MASIATGIGFSITGAAATTTAESPGGVGESVRGGRDLPSALHPAAVTAASIATARIRAVSVT